MLGARGVGVEADDLGAGGDGAVDGGGDGVGFGTGDGDALGAAADEGVDRLGLFLRVLTPIMPIAV